MLPSPIIEGTLPAFYEDEKGIVRITIPFSMSRAVNRNEIDGFKLKIKNLQGSSYLKTLTSISEDYNNYIVSFELDTSKEENIFNLGSFYKAQLAYIDRNGVTGYYSTVGIIKYTAKPTLSILGLSVSKNNTHQYTYTGVYSQDGEKKDPTEKEYAYRFVIKNNKNEIVEDTGYLIHNSSNDVEFYESSDTFSYTYDLTLNDKYSITYSVKTNNGLEISGPSYRIVQKEAIPLDTISKIYPKLNYDNGLIEIFFNINPNPITEEEKKQAEEDRLNEQFIKGSFILTRASEDYQYQNWETIVEFSLFAQKPSSQSWKDFTVEQGKKYKYAIQQYSKINQLYSKKLISNEILADFEDIFLYDGEKQLKIKFNPKVSSFKKNIFEAKVDTLGSKYPFIFRNGQVEYREFPIQGLVSYLMDEQSFFGNNTEQFITEERKTAAVYQPFKWQKHENQIIEKAMQRNQYQREYNFLYIQDTTSSTYIKWTDYLTKIYGTNDPLVNKYRDYSDYDKYFDSTKKYYTRFMKNVNDLDLDKIKLNTTNLVSYNISLEREFKMSVLNWLTNGKPKLFRSPTEGNFIVRLMNVSLSPEDKVNRMLHSFSCTAYEIADFSYETLKSFNFINTQSFKNSYFKIQSIPLVTEDPNYAALSNITYEQLVKDGPYYASGSLMPTAGQLEFLELTDVPSNIQFKINGENICMGGSGYLKIEIPVENIQLINTSKDDFMRIINDIDEYETEQLTNNTEIITLTMDNENYQFTINDLNANIEYLELLINNKEFEMIQELNALDISQFENAEEYRREQERIENYYRAEIDLLNNQLNEKIFEKNKILSTIEENNQMINVLKDKNSLIEKLLKSLKEEKELILSLKGVLTVGYYTDIEDTFSYISNVEIQEVCGRQFIGEHDNIVVNELTDNITEPVSYHLIRAWKRKLLFAKTDENNQNIPLDIDEDIENYNFSDVTSLYQYIRNTDTNLGNLYKQVYFTQTQFYDSMYTESLEREKEYRTSTNESLHNEKDYVLYLLEGKLFKYDLDKDDFIVVDWNDDDIENEENFNGPFFIQKPIEYIYDPYPKSQGFSDEYIYLSDDSYYTFKDLWREWLALNPNSLKCQWKQEVFNSTYNLITYIVTIQTENDTTEQNIDLSEIKYRELNNLDKLIKYATSKGILTDLTYSVQIKNYDISKNAALIEEKKKIDAYLHILSYDCIELYKNKLSQYQYLLNGVYNSGFSPAISYTYNGITVNLTDNYKNAYKKYLSLLKSHIDALEKFNKEG